MKREFKKFRESLFGNIVMGFLAAVIFYFVVMRFALSTDMPMVAVVSNSMKHSSSLDSTHYQWLENRIGYNESYMKSWPISGGFAMGDMPIIKGSKEYKVGDVIVYSVSGSKAPIIHRIIKINDDGSYQTKGDNNNGQLSYEKKVEKEQIHGKVIFVVPKVGYFKVVFNKLVGV